jgi:hypothetical protein
LGDQIEKEKMGESYGTCGENRNFNTNLMGRPEVKTPLRKPIRREEGNIKVNFKEIGWQA